MFQYLLLIYPWSACEIHAVFHYDAYLRTTRTHIHLIPGNTLYFIQLVEKNWAHTEKDVKNAASGVRVLFFAYRCYMLGAIYLKGFPPLIYVSLPLLKYF